MQCSALVLEDSGVIDMTSEWLLLMMDALCFYFMHQDILL